MKPTAKYLLWINLHAPIKRNVSFELRHLVLLLSSELTNLSFLFENLVLPSITSKTLLP